MASKEERIKEKRDLAIAKSKGSTGEPIVTKGNYTSELSAALAYYNVHETEANKRKWLSSYLKSGNHNHELELLKDAPDYAIVQIGTIARLIQREQYISDEHKASILKKFKSIETIIKKKKQESEVKEVKPKVDKTLEVTSKHLAEIAFALDEMLTKNKNFDINSYIAKNNVPLAIVKNISQFYTKTLKELDDIPNCEQLKEAYSCYNSRVLKNYHNVIQIIVNAGQQMKVRAPRVSKPKAPAVIVKNLKFLPSFKQDINLEDSINLTSIKPTDILGAKELWVYNTKTKQLSVYKSNTGLGVKGSALTNYDVGTSKMRRLRKPEIFLSDNMAKVALNKRFNELTTIDSTPNGRVGPDTILLKVF